MNKQQFEGLRTDESINLEQETVYISSQKVSLPRFQDKGPKQSLKSVTGGLRVIIFKLAFDLPLDLNSLDVRQSLLHFPSKISHYGLISF